MALQQQCVVVSFLAQLAKLLAYVLHRSCHREDPLQQVARKLKGLVLQLLSLLLRLLRQHGRIEVRDYGTEGAEGGW